ncbi:UDP-N-acetylmuramoyl-L-alanine--D-glutamate ligase [Serinibacter arcticus]|uniref:UDP-N-acetylmuramoylalanine--D-glutamate ligase n=1 Tax=Serinibacter arcticus TaxID=1655435 RepID=A0A2U1ZSR7_9MICO|nr:UDP-N-acetylmuramoyl-L-alanine--D-glutamate ligase [Serinibacter arcticus]PWD50028.1 UDP-N-acetylmuramoyl-L-alanine--D-glutamate ligase [Serinibacter arcticus]
MTGPDTGPVGLRGTAAREALRGARTLVVGLGLTGSAAARTLHALGADVVAVDSRPEVAERARRELPGVHVVDGADEQALAEAAVATSPRLAVVSPGLPPSSPLVALPRAAGVRILTEFDLAWMIRLDDAPWLFVTGTNGKTTTAQMTSALLRAGGLHAPPLGNMGVAVSTVALEGIADEAGVVRAPQAWPIEIAALQLHDTSLPQPQASICLNVAEDHLDWFGTMAAYRSDKAKVYQGVRGACVYPTWEPGAREMVEGAEVVEGARAVGLVLGAPALAQVGIVEDAVIDRAFHPRRRTEGLILFTTGDLAHLGLGEAGLPPHIVTNAMAAASLAREAGVEPEAVAAGLRGFSLDAHRIARVAVLDGVTWVNDSKATNAHAAAASLRGLADGTCVWLAGGDAKGAPLDDLVRDFAGKMRAVVLIGRDPRPWTEPLARHAPDVPVIVVPDGETEAVMRGAVAQAQRLARPGDTVLMAPAGASWDQFRSYGHRGDAFAHAVGQLVDDARAGGAGEQA